MESTVASFSVIVVILGIEICPFRAYYGLLPLVKLGVNWLFIDFFSLLFSPVTCCNTITIDSTDPDLSSSWKTPKTWTMDGTFTGPNAPGAGWPVYRRDDNNAYYLARIYISPTSYPNWKWRISHNTIVGMPSAGDNTVLSGYVFIDNTAGIDGVPCPRFATTGNTGGVNLDDITISCTTSEWNF